MSQQEEHTCDAGETLVPLKEPLNFRPEIMAGENDENDSEAGEE